MQGHDQIETIPLPDTQRAPLIGSIPDVSPAWQYANQVYTVIYFLACYQHPIMLGCFLLTLFHLKYFVLK